LRTLTRGLIIVLFANILAIFPPLGTAWAADSGDGLYQNPILHADYSDPDVIRVGDMYYMTASSFNSTPGLPLLASSDLVNWELVGHALPALVPADVFSKPQPGKGVWAPCLRYHDGKFWIFYPDPDFGVYVMTAKNFAGPWSAPHLLLAGKGIIDPAPLWDDDGKAWLLHAWAKSRSGINNILTLRSMAPDGRSLNDQRGTDIINGDRLPGYHTLEGPKLYKANGYYYVFAPAGGVEHGWQSVFRSRRIEGPYEERIVMEQGRSSINGPHQGAWVDDVQGHDWFIHFQDKGAYGRILHLQPMQWKEGWPVIGIDQEGRGVGEPVLRHEKPAGRDRGVRAPATSDEFSAPALGLQWQWNANFRPDWYSLSARPGFLRLYAQSAQGVDNLRFLPSVLTQKFPAETFTVDTQVELHGAGPQRAGLVLLGMRYAWLGLRRAGAETQLVFATCEAPVAQPLVPCVEKVESLRAVAGGPVRLRMQVAAGGKVQFFYSLDQSTFTPAGQPLVAAPGRWVGAQIGLFSDGVPGAAAYADVDYLRISGN
jgi:beta-xylosidase